MVFIWMYRFILSLISNRWRYMFMFVLAIDKKKTYINNVNIDLNKILFTDWLNSSTSMVYLSIVHSNVLRYRRCKQALYYITACIMYVYDICVISVDKSSINIWIVNWFSWTVSTKLKNIIETMLLDADSETPLFHFEIIMIG